MNRRDFILATLSTSSFMALAPKAHAFEQLARLAPRDMSPLQRLSSYSGSSVVEGDTHDEAHEIFWNKDGYIARKGGIPRPSAHFDVVIVGGGMAGLTAAYHLRGKRILMLEGNPRLGGNSKSQINGRSYFSQGAAYIVANEEGDEIDTMLTDLRLKSRFRQNEHGDDVVEFRGRTVPGFFDGATDASRADSFRAFRAKMHDVFENSYPELPVWGEENRAGFNSLDRLKFSDWLKRELGTLHPHLAEFVELYCWSSFGTTSAELSAAQGLNFLSCDLAGTQVLPGGNGLIAQALYEKIKTRTVTFRAPAFAVDVVADGAKTQVCFKSEAGELETVTADHCVVTVPKMVAKHVVRGLPAAQSADMKELDYRAYLVGNVLLDRKLTSPGYDLFSMQGQFPDDSYQDSKERVFADVVYADWAGNDSAEKSALTLYMPLPYTMAQQYLFVDTLYQKYHDRIRTRLSPVLAGHGLGWQNVQGVRLVRYGHAMPVGSVGGVASGLFERAHQSLGNIHFAGQDNWGNPCFETAFATGMEAAKKISR